MSKKKTHRRGKNPGKKLVTETLVPKKEYTTLTEASSNQLSARDEKHVYRTFFIAESILVGLVLLGTLALIYTIDITKIDPRTCLQQNPRLALDLIFLCMQLLVVWILSRAHAHLKKREVESAISIVVVLLCTECLLRNPMGVLCLAILLWKITRAYRYDFAGCVSRRGFLGTLGVLSQALLVAAIAVLHLLFSLKLG